MYPVPFCQHTLIAAMFNANQLHLLMLMCNHLPALSTCQLQTSLHLPQQMQSSLESVPPCILLLLLLGMQQEHNL